MSISSIAVLLLVALAAVCQASIEREPVKVTYRNSGPTYDIEDEPDRIKVLRASIADSNSNEPSKPDNPLSSREAGDGGNDDDIAHVSVVRRVFLIPMRPSMLSGDNPFASPAFMSPKRGENENEGESESESVPPRVKNPWVISPMFRHHILGADSASRSPTPDSSSEVSKSREESASPPADRIHDQSLDSVNMFINMMLNSLLTQAHQQASQGEPANNFNTDLNKDASDKVPMKPPTKTNETSEEIVEIDGKKFLKKTQITRHVGENLRFMTRHLTFIPLNETDSSTPSSTSTTTTTSTPTTILSTSTVPDAQPSSTTQEAREVESTTSSSSSFSTSARPGLENERLMMNKPEETPKELPTPKP